MGGGGLQNGKIAGPNFGVPPLSFLYPPPFLFINGRGRHVKFDPYEKGGGGKSFSHADGGGGDTTSFGVVFTW